MTKLYAFWRYDRFPFVLGGEVLGIDDEGFVHVRGYDGMRFRPLKIVTAAAGERINESLESLRAAEAKARREHDTAWRARVEALLPEAAR